MPLTSRVSDRRRYAPGMQQQLARFHAALDAGMPRRGWKIGINVPEVLERLGLAHPGVGWIDGNRLHRSGDVVRGPANADLRVEPELCLSLAAPLPASTSPDAALACVAGVAPALEIVDYARPTSGLDDLVSHSMFHAGCVLGPWRSLEWARDLGERRPLLEVSGVPGPPPRPDLVPDHLGELLVFVAAFLEAFDESLESGDLVLSGSYTPAALPVGPGSEVRADFGLLGDVEAVFATGPPGDGGAGGR